MYLVLETTSPGLSLGLFTAEGAAVAEIVDPTPRAADTLHTRLEEVLKSQSLAAESITHVILTVGPGSFTGARIGLAVANALKLLNPALSIIALSTLQAYALQLTSHQSPVTSHSFTILLDAAGQTAYRQSFSAQGQPTTQPDCLPVTEALAALTTPYAASPTLMLAPTLSLTPIRPTTLLQMSKNPTYHLPAEPLYLKPLNYKPASTNHE